MRRRFARWKTKYQRVAGYVGLATFAIVLLQLIRDFYTSNPYFAFGLEFPVFAAFALGIAVLGIVILAELDWRFVFAHEQAQTNIKNPLMYPMVYWSAWMLTHSSHHPEIEAKLRETFRGMDAEELFDSLMKELSV
jgi:uncharacterized protein (DUF2062 family)